MILGILAACSPASDPADALPPHAPGVLLLASTDGSEIEVHQAHEAELYVDLDSPSDDREGFRYQLTAGDAVLYERTTNGPVLVDAFLDYWGGQSGLDVLAALPTLGHFPLIVPRIEGATHVRFQLRSANGTFEDAGEFALSSVASESVGPYEGVLDVATLHEGGPSENRLDIVLLPDGFQASEMDRFHRKADRFTEALLNQEPFATYRDWINIHRVDVASNESGASFDCPTCASKDTAFGSIFAVEAINRFSGSTYDSRAMFQTEQWSAAIAMSAVPWDTGIVLVNTETPSGMAVHFATTSTNWPDFEATAIHELGHSLGQLGDEYTFDACIRDDRLGLPPNITDDPQNPPWSHWIEPGMELPSAPGAQGIGAFRPAYNCDQLYRPRRNCAMNSGTQFCQVCTEQLVRRLLTHVDPVDRIEFKGRRARGVGPVDTVQLEWSRDGEVFATTAPGEYTAVGTRPFEVRATLITDSVRIGGTDLEQVYAFE